MEDERRAAGRPGSGPRSAGKKRRRGEDGDDDDDDMRGRDAKRSNVKRRGRPSVNDRNPQGGASPVALKMMKKLIDIVIGYADR